MQPPVLVEKTDISMTISWTQIADEEAGNSPIISYKLLWDDATGSTDIVLAQT